MSDIPVGSVRSSANRALEAAIYVGLAALLALACIRILLPFLPMIAWGIIISVAAYPSFKKLERALGDRGALAAVLFTVAFLAVLIVPSFLMADSLINAIQAVAAHVRKGDAIIPPPPNSIATWPVVGSPLSQLWAKASNDFSDIIRQFAPQIKAAIPGVLSASAGVGFTVLQLIVSIVISGIVLANAQSAYELTRSLANRLFGAKGPEYQQLVGNTIRSVTFGILGVAVIQAVCASIGFFVVGLPAAGMWSVLFLIGAILQVGMIVLIPAVIYVFATAATTKAVIFLIWCMIVGLMDNVLKPILLGRGSTVPIMIVFLGSIGGFVAMGIIGLFVGAIVLSVGYKLFLAWLEGTPDQIVT